MKLPALKPVLDKRQVALARARFKAWWEGEDFDPAAAEAALAEAAEAVDAAGPTATAPSPDLELFEPETPPLSPRFEALFRLWGEHRITPGDAAEEGQIGQRLGLVGEAALAIIGPGHAAPIIAVAGGFPGAITAHEWRDDTRAACEAAVARAGLAARVRVAPADLDTIHFASESVDGLWSVDDFTYADHAAGLAHQITRALKPGAAALIDTYSAEQGAALAPSFATAFAEPHLRAHAALCEMFHDCGLRLEHDDDISAAHVALAKRGFKRLEEALAAAAQGGLGVHTLREIAWEAEAWRARIRFLNQKRLRRVRLMFRKPATSD